MMITGAAVDVNTRFRSLPDCARLNVPPESEFVKPPVPSVVEPVTIENFSAAKLLMPPAAVAIRQV